MSEPDAPLLGPLPSRYVARATALNALTAVLFFGYLAAFLPPLEGLKATLLSRAGLVFLVLGALDVMVMWGWLKPFGEALAHVDARQPVPDPLAEAGRQRAESMPYLAGGLTLVVWLLGCGAVAVSVRGDGIPSDVLSASTIAGACNGLVAGLLVFFLALGDLHPVRAALQPEDREPVQTLSVGMRLLALCVVGVLVAMAMMGTTAYLVHRATSDAASVAGCERSLQALGRLDLTSQAVAQAASATCGGPVTVSTGEQVLYSEGPDVHAMPVGPGPRGTLVRVPARGGVALSALAGARARVASDGAFAGKTVLFALVALVVAALFGLVASRALTAPLRSLEQGLQRVAGGDLRLAVPAVSGDEIGSLAASVGAMLHSLRELLGGVGGALQTLAEQVSTVSGAGARVRSGLKARDQTAAAAMEELTQMDHSVAGVGKEVSVLSEYVSNTSAAMAQFAATLEEVRRRGVEMGQAVSGAQLEVGKLAASADDVRREIAVLAGAARSTLVTIAESGTSLRRLSEASLESERVAQWLFAETEAGRRVVDEGVRGVEAIRGVVGEAKARVEALGARSADITAIVDFIAEVAGRTNLLSLNAAIIAAQAGEQGKPFGVVADQIRELASQIGSSTKRIADIIAGVRIEVDSTAALIQQSDELATSGVDRARESGQALKRISEGTKRARQVAASITPAVAAHAENSKQIEQLAARVVDMAQGFEAVDQLVRGGRAIEALHERIGPVTKQVGRALDEQTVVGRRQLESLEEMTRMISRLNEAMARHGDGTARAIKRFWELQALAEQDSTAVDEVARASEVLTRGVDDLRGGLGRFKT